MKVKSAVIVAAAVAGGIAVGTALERNRLREAGIDRIESCHNVHSNWSEVVWTKDVPPEPFPSKTDRILMAIADSPVFKAVSGRLSPKPDPKKRGKAKSPSAEPHNTPDGEKGPDRE